MKDRLQSEGGGSAIPRIRASLNCRRSCPGPGTPPSSGVAVLCGSAHAFALRIQQADRMLANHHTKALIALEFEVRETGRNARILRGWGLRGKAGCLRGAVM